MGGKIGDSFREQDEASGEDVLVVSVHRTTELAGSELALSQCHRGDGTSLLAERNLPKSGLASGPK